MIIPLLLLLAIAQDLPPVSAATDYAHLHEGVNPPKLLHSTDPEFTPDAVAVGISGAVVLQAVIDAKGDVAYASVLSSLPAGLDVKALATVKRWHYAPGVMDNEIIPVLTTIEVLFRPPYKTPDPASDRRQEAFQRILKRTSDGHQTPTAEEVATLKELAAHGLIPAVELWGEWQALGLGTPKNAVGGSANISKAAAANNARALYFLGKTERAAYFGSSKAQFELGNKREQEHNFGEAKRYFRLCAATAHPECEYRLGRLLVDGPDLNPNDFSQGVAWLELAKGHQNADALKLYPVAFAKLSSIQQQWVAQLKPHLELRNYHGVN